MNYLKTVCFAVLLGVSFCGTKHQVITDSWKIDEVKGTTYYHQGKEVTDKISPERG